MKFNKFMMVGIFLLAIFMIGAANAADENVTDTADDVLSVDDVNDDLSLESVDEDEISASSGTFAELQSLVDNTASGKTLYLDKDYSRTDTTRITISKAITIDGQGHTIDANKKSNIAFYVTNSGAVIKDLTFINGAYTYVYCTSGRCSVYDSSFEKCSGSSGSYGYGGAIHYGNAYNCSFVDCSAGSYGYGGAIYYGNAYNCSFVDCSAGYYGGAIYSGNAYDSSFVNCTAKTGIAAIYGGTASNCTFVNCKALVAIGSIEAKDIFYGDTAYVYVRGDSNAGSVEVTVNGKTKKVRLGNSVYFDDLNVGTYDVKVVYPGNANYESQTFTTSFKVKKANPISSISVSPGYPSNNGQIAYTGKNATLYIYMNAGSVLGYVNVTVNGVSQNVKISGYTVSVPLGVLKLGSYNISVSYVGNANYKAQTKTLSFKVVKQNPINHISTNYPYTYSNGNNNYGNVEYDGRTTTLYIYMNDGASGNVKVTVNGASQRHNILGSTVSVPLGVLKLGSYNISVSHDGNANFNAQTVSLAFNVVKADPIRSLEVYPGYPSNNGQISYTGQDATLYIYMNNGVSGHVNVVVDGTSKKVKVSGSTVSVPLGVLKRGSHSISVSHDGNANFNAQTKKLTFKVVKGTPMSSIRVYPGYPSNNGQISYTGQDATLDIYMNGGSVPGYVNVTVNGVSQNVKISGSTVSVPLGVLKRGSHSISVSYAESANFNAQTKTLAFKVVKGDPISSISVSPDYPSNNGQIQYTGANATLLIYMKSDKVSGNVNVTVDGVSQNVKVSGSTVRVPLGILKLGSHSISVNYPGNTNFNAQTKTLAFKVVKGTPMSSIVVSPGYPSNNDQIQYTGANATLLIYMKSDKVSGNVNVTVNGVSQKVKISGSTVSVPLGVLNQGSYSISVSYAGSANFNAQTKTLAFNVVKGTAITRIYVSPGNPSNNAKLQFTYNPSRLYVRLASSNVPGSIKVTINGDSYVRTTSGRSAVSFSLGIMKPGKYDIKVVYAGNGDFKAQTQTLSFSVVKKNPISSVRVYYNGTSYYDDDIVDYSAESAKIYINMNDIGVLNNQRKYAPGNVHVTINGASHKAIKITGPILSLPLGILNLGANEIKVTYSGSAYCNAQNFSITLNVVKSNPIKSVELPESTVGFGDDATIKVNMMNDKINGNVWVTLSDENKTQILTEKIAIVKGVASYDVPGLGLGKYYLHIYFAGNEHYNAQTVKRTFSVVKKTPILSFDVSAYYGEDTVITVNMNNCNGNVWFTVSDENKTKILTDKMHIENGVATRSISGLTFGSTYYLHLYYAGNVHYSAQTLKSSFVVDKKTPISSVSISNKGLGEDLNISVKMFDNKVNGNVWITVAHSGNTTKEKIPIVNGYANYTIVEPTYGKYDFTLSYSGNTYYKAQTLSESTNEYNSYVDLKVAKTTEGKNTVLTVKLPKYAEGKVKFEVNGITYVANVTDGVAVVKISNLEPGAYALKTTFSSGNNKVYGYFNTRSITIK